MNGSYSDLWGDAADEALTDAQRTRLRAAHRAACKQIERHCQRRQQAPMAENKRQEDGK